SAGRLNCPFPPEAVERVNPVASLSTVTVAPTSTAPDLSVTVPDIVAVPNCASKCAAANRPSSRTLFCIFTPSSDRNCVSLRLLADSIYPKSAVGPVFRDGACYDQVTTRGQSRASSRVSKLLTLFGSPIVRL